MPDEGYPPKPKRFWTYTRDGWDPRWWHKAGWPYFGGDEWGRRTVVIGLWCVGYLVVALWTCWCVDCHLGRAQTYDDARESLQEASRQRDLREIGGGRA